MPEEILSASQTLYATHNSTANIKLLDSQCLSIECWYVPNFKVILVSRYKLAKSGFKTVFCTKLDCWILFDNNIKVFTNNKNGLQIIKMNEDKIFVANATQNEGIDWHNRLGHILFEKLKKLSSIIPHVECGKPRVNCDVCLTSKAKRNIFNRTKEVLGGPYEPDCEGCKYFITFIDEVSRNCIYLCLLLNRNLLFIK